jgi:hypothetical protein
MGTILSGQVLWSYDHEVMNRNLLDNIGAQVSFVKPFHRHSGQIILSEDKLCIFGDEALEISLASIDNIYLGFDEIFPPLLVKNAGLFWQPLRLKLLNGQQLYLIIDHNMFGAKNQLWFDGLKAILSD